MSRLLAVTVAGLLFVSACTSGDGLTAEVTDRDALPVPQVANDGVDSRTLSGSLISDSCPFTTPANASTECYRLVVPSAWADLASSEVSVQVAMFSATEAGDKTTDDENNGSENGTVLWIEGGPGAGPLASVDLWFDTAFSSLNRSFDIVVFDPRGTGFSLPSLDCSEIDDLYELEVGFDIGDQLTAIRDCSDRLARTGVDVSSYDSLATARDLEALRRQLGVDRWNLVGQSYGTRLAQTYVREFPDSVRAMVLDGAYSIDDDPADDSRQAVPALDRLLASCKADAGCNSEFPSIERRFGTVMQNLATSPIEVESVDPLTGETSNYLVDDVQFADLVFQSLYDTYVSSSWPRIISDLEDGNTASLDFLVAQSGNGVGNGDDIGVYYSVQCRDEWSFSNDEPDEIPSAFAESDEISSGAWSLFCPSWRAGVAESVEAYRITTEVPTLILGGEFDPITPREGALELQAQLGAEFFEFAQIGHGTIGVLECADAIATQFLTDLELRSTSCADNHLNPNLFVDSLASSPLAEPSELTLFGTIIELKLPEWFSPGAPGDGYLISDQRLSDFNGILIDLWEGDRDAEGPVDWYRENYFTDDPGVGDQSGWPEHIAVFSGATTEGVVVGIESFMYLAVVDLNNDVTVAISHFTGSENSDALDRLIEIAESVQLVSR